MKLYVDERIININVLRDLKSKFRVVFEDSYDVKIKLKNNILSIDEIDVDCGHWIEQIEAGNLDLRLSDLIDRVLIEFTSVRDIIL